MSVGLRRFWGMLVGGRGVLRETREDRRRRRCRVALRRADEQLDGGSCRSALYWAKRAHRFGPGDPRTLMVLGLAWGENHRYELALKHLEAAYRALREGFRDSPLAEELDVVLAVEAARMCARLRLDARSEQESEVWAERVLDWAGIAASDDAQSTEVLADDPLLRDLGDQVWLLHASDPAFEVVA